MQFIPATWATWGEDANGDGTKDPNNIYDAALATGMYLCAGNRDLSVDADLHQAILGYNHSQDYLNTVLSWLEFYRNGTHEVPDGSGVLPSSPGASNPDPSTTPPAPHPSTSPTAPGGTHGHEPGGPASTPPSTPPPGDGTSPPSTGDGDGPGSGTPTDPAPLVVKRLVNAGPLALDAVAGSPFDDHAVVRAVDAVGKPVPGSKVRFEIVGATDARFVAGATQVTVTTGKDGTANAPAVRAGEQTGDFTIRATSDVKGVTALDYKATVTARKADSLVRTSDTALTAAPGAEFAEPLGIKATLAGAAAPNVAVSATMMTSVIDPAVPDKGPHFKDAAGNPVRALTDLKTDADGVLQLPKIFADDTTGTFLLRLSTAGGGTLTVQLTVAAPQ
jgi:hypothetical protein